MRCKFCGWPNPDGKDRCEKCNKPLDNSSEIKGNMATIDNHDRPTDRQANTFNPKATLPENVQSVDMPLIMTAYALHVGILLMRHR